MRLVRLRDRKDNDLEVVDLDSLMPEAFSERGNRFVLIREDEVSLCAIVDRDSAVLHEKGSLDDSAIKEFLEQEAVNYY